jgi:PAS domain S-box-containing protein
VSGFLRTRLDRLVPKWPLLLALAFSVYSAALLAYSIGTWWQMKQDANNFLLADNQRRASALADLAGDLQNRAVANASLHEIGAYLVNRDLGMSPRYGLDYSLSEIRRRLVQQAADFSQQWGNVPSRIAYIDKDGRTLADSAPEFSSVSPSGLDALEVPTSLDGKPGIRVDPASGTVLVWASVHFRGYPEGKVGLQTTAEVFYRNLLTSESTAGYSEWLVTVDGVAVPGKAAASGLPPALRARLASLPNDSVTDFDAGLAPGISRWLPARNLIVKTRVPGLGLQLVTQVPADRAYGHIVSGVVLLIAAVVPLLMLLIAYRLDRMRLKADRLQAEVSVAERERLRAEIRYSELAEEIERRTLAEQALADSEERWQLAVAGTNDGIWDWDLRTGEAFFSARWKAMLGLDDETPGVHIDEWTERIHLADREAVLSALEAHLCGQIPFFQSEHRLRCSNNEYKWVEVRGRALIGVGRTAVRMAGSITDISERREAEARLRERTEQLDAIFSLSPDGFVSFGPDHRVRYISPAFQRITGLECGPLGGIGIADLLDRLSARCAAGQDLRSLLLAPRDDGQNGRGGDVHSGKLRVALAGPGGRVVEVSLRRGRSDAVPEILYLRDMTVETEVERMKDEFLATAAHELRTPMASIFGYCELLLHRDIEAGMQKEFLDIIYRNSELIIKIINELLDLARIEARRRADMKIERLDACELVREALSRFKVPPGREPAGLLAGQASHWLRGDRDTLIRALENVLSNAYKYSAENSGVTVSLVDDASAEQMAYRVGLRIGDQGIGMTPDQLQRVCERFYRADASGNVPGTGLGMSIVKEIVELLGGSVEISSQIGVGTEVTLWLPAAMADRLAA